MPWPKGHHCWYPYSWSVPEVLPDMISDRWKRRTRESPCRNRGTHKQSHLEYQWHWRGSRLFWLTSGQGRPRLKPRNYPRDFHELSCSQFLCSGELQEVVLHIRPSISAGTLQELIQLTTLCWNWCLKISQGQIFSFSNACNLRATGLNWITRKYWCITSMAPQTSCLWNRAHYSGVTTSQKITMTTKCSIKYQIDVQSLLILIFNCYFWSIK